MCGILFRLVVVFISAFSISAWAGYPAPVRSAHRYFSVLGEVTKVADQSLGQLYILKGKLKSRSSYDSSSAIDLASELQTEGLKLVFDPATDAGVSDCHGPGVFTIDTGSATDAEIVTALQDRAAFTLIDFQCSTN